LTVFKEDKQHIQSALLTVFKEDKQHIQSALLTVFKDDKQHIQSALLTVFKEDKQHIQSALLTVFKEEMQHIQSALLTVFKEEMQHQRQRFFEYSQSTLFKEDMQHLYSFSIDCIQRLYSKKICNIYTRRFTCKMSTRAHHATQSRDVSPAEHTATHCNTLQCTLKLDLHNVLAHRPADLLHIFASYIAE